MVVTWLLQMTPSIPHNRWRPAVMHWTCIAILNAANKNKIWLAMDFTWMDQLMYKSQEQQVSACLNVPKLLKWRNKWSTNQQQRHCDPWMDRASCVFECVFLLTDNQAHYDDSAATAGFSNLTKWWVILKVWSEWGPDMRTTAQNNGSLVWALEWARGVVPSHLFLKLGQDRSAPRAFLRQCALVKCPDNWQTDARACWRQNPNIKNIPTALSQHRVVRTQERGRIVPPHWGTSPSDGTHLVCCSTRSSHVLQWQTTTNSQLGWCLLERWVT